MNSKDILEPRVLHNATHPDVLTQYCRRSDHFKFHFGVAADVFRGMSPDSPRHPAEHVSTAETKIQLCKMKRPLRDGPSAAIKHGNRPIFTFGMF